MIIWIIPIAMVLEIIIKPATILINNFYIELIVFYTIIKFKYNFKNIFYILIFII